MRRLDQRPSIKCRNRSGANRVLLASLETPLATVDVRVRREETRPANDLNPAPACAEAGGAEILSLVDVLTPNRNRGRDLGRDEAKATVYGAGGNKNLRRLESDSLVREHDLDWASVRRRGGGSPRRPASRQAGAGFRIVSGPSPLRTRPRTLDGRRGGIRRGRRKRDSRQIDSAFDLWPLVQAPAFRPKRR